MKDIKKIKERREECDKCENYAVTKITTQAGEPLKLCPKHERKFEEDLKEKIQDKFEGMSEEEIAKEVFQKGESLI